MGVNFSEFDATATILEALGSGNETDIDDTDIEPGKAAAGTNFDTADY